MLKIHKPDTFLNVEDTEQHLYIVNFSKLFEINIQPLLLADLQKYTCLKKISKDAKALFYHHIIFGMCEYILHLSKNNQQKMIIYFSPSDLKGLIIYDFFPEKETQELISKILTQIHKKIPLHIFYTTHSFYYFLGASSGKKQELLALIRHVGDVSFDNYTFNKALKFASKHGLTFLSDDYFQRLMVKQLMFL